MSGPWFLSEVMLPGLRRPEREDSPGPPAEVADWLTALRLLKGVPFAYLVPDAAMLPPESIRFFWLDRDWTDAAVEGALSAAGAFSSVRSQAQAADAATRAALDRHERSTSPHRDVTLPEGVTKIRGGGTVVKKDGFEAEQRYDTTTGGAEVITGFVVRSRAIAGWPGMHVIARRDGRDLTLLRVERLAPAVMLVLIDGVPDEVALEEPKRGLQFGVDVPDTAVPEDSDPKGRRRVLPRDPSTGLELTSEPDIGVPFRSGSTGVVDMAALAGAIGAADLPNVGSDVSTAELTTQLLQFPYRQWFRGDGERPGGAVGVVLHTTVPLMVLAHLADVPDD